MGLIKCIDCGKEISDRILSCPNCGCPISESKKKNTSNENKLQHPGDKLDCSVLEFTISYMDEKAKMIQLLAPVIENVENANEVIVNIQDYFKPYRTILSENAYCVIYGPLVNALRRIVDQQEFNKRDNGFQAKVALKTYEHQVKNIKAPGLGFSIITGDPINAAIYSAMNKAEQEKQYDRQMQNINNLLLKNLSEIHTVNKLSEFTIGNLLTCIDETLRLTQELIESKKKIVSSLEVYKKRDKYSIGKHVENIILWEFLAKTLVDNEYVQIASFDESDELGILEGSGYIHTYNGKYKYTTTHFYWSSGKFETEIYREFNSNEVNDKDKININEYEEKYGLAEQELLKKHYYEAAIIFGELKNYKDALERSYMIWNKYIPKSRFLCMGSFYIYGLSSTGEIYGNEKYVYGGNVKINPHYSQITSWKNVIQITEKTHPMALTCNGTIKNIYEGNLVIGEAPQVQGNGKDWENVIHITKFSNTLAAIHRSGGVSAVGNNKNNECMVSEWENVGQLNSYFDDVVGVTKDGRVFVAGKNSSEEYRAWKNVKQVALGVDFVAGLFEDGTVSIGGVNSYSKCNTSTWKNIRRIKAFHNCLVGITKEGEVCITGGEDERDKGLEYVLKNWKNVVDIVIVKEEIPVALLLDGTVITHKGTYNVSNWKDIVSIYCDSDDLLYGITKEGNVLYTGTDAYSIGKTVSNWKLFTDINCFYDDRKKMITEELARATANKEFMQRELNELKGLFIKKKKNRIEEELQIMENKIKTIQYHLDNLPDFVK